MTKILNFALKIKGVVGRVAHAKSFDPATPPKINLKRAPDLTLVLHMANLFENFLSWDWVLPGI